MAAAQQAVRRQIRRAAELHDSLRDKVGVLLLFACMFQKFLGDGARMNTLGHEIVALVSQHTNNLRRKRFVENLDRGFSVAAVSRRHGTVLDMLARALAQCLYIGEKWRVFQSFSLVDVRKFQPQLYPA